MTMGSDFKILHAQVGDSEDAGYIRILINGLVKYIRVDPGILSNFRTTPRNKLASELPPIPAGDWTTVKLSRNTSDGNLSFHSAEKATLPAVEGIWHPVQIDYCDLVFTKSFTDNVYEVAIRDSSSSQSKLPQVMVAKFTPYPRFLEFFTRENEIYAKVQDLNIVPRFLGNLTENNGMGPRPIGYLLEKIEGRNANSLSDFPLCRSLLRKFHNATGCAHGDPNRNNFIIKPDGLGAVIYDFEFANERGEDRRMWEIDNLERNMREDEESKQEMGEVEWKEECLKEEIGDMAPMSEEDELRRDELGVDEWIAEKVRERLREEQNQAI